MRCHQHMSFLTALVAAALPPAAATYWIFGGTQPVVETRLDPIVYPGIVSAHVHSVAGGSRFSPTYSYSDLVNSQCSTISVQTDKSNYWTVITFHSSYRLVLKHTQQPKLYYHDQDAGTYTPIPNSFNVYYLRRPGPANETIHAFPNGLRMLAGDPTRRVYNASNFEDQAITYVCLDYDNDHTGDPDWAERQDFFTHQCPDAMRAQVFFPSCWDGVNLDSADHKSHMAYPIQDYETGDCPSTHPVHLVSLFYEMFVSVDQFPYEAGSWVWSFGDNTGLGFHGDFQDGWTDNTVLQSALDTCGDIGGDLASCPPLAPLVNDDAATACHIEGQIVDESIGSLSAPLLELPGCNPLWVGTGPKPTCNPAVATPGLVDAKSTLPSGWTEVGCIAEGTTGRALSAASTINSTMTKPLCANYCDALGYQYAGVEYYTECYCDNTLENGATTALRTWYECSTTCGGNPNEDCGGPNRLTLMQKS
ncbi:WSC-domain-containing protein [Cytidiella melzeri]|nr:WSC-domain-containing protein [Cytidiella melzeri]